MRGERNDGAYPARREHTTAGDLIAGWLTPAGHDVVRAQDGAAALAALDQNSVDVLLTDQHMAYLDGVRLARLAHDTPSRPRVLLLLSERWSLADEVRAREAGVDRLVPKDALRAETLVREVESLLRSSARPKSL